MRADTEESAFSGRSHCPQCQAKLSWWELIPLLSFIILKGRCSHCHKKISSQYPLVELITGILFVLVYWRFRRIYALYLLWTPATSILERVLIFINVGFWFYWVCVFIIISVYDLKKYLVLNNVLIPAIGLSFIWRLILSFLVGNTARFGNQKWTLLPRVYTLGEIEMVRPWFISYAPWSLLAATIIPFGLCALFIWLTKEKYFGWGDALVILFIGVILGWNNALVAYLISALLGGLIGIILILSKKKTLKSYLPFVPILSFSALAVLLCSDLMHNGFYTFMMYLYS
jgi:leader peptidase (prepilin peptidase)/N-methyltransferase